MIFSIKRFLLKIATGTKGLQEYNKLANISTYLMQQTMSVYTSNKMESYTVGTVSIVALEFPILSPSHNFINSYLASCLGLFMKVSNYRKTNRQVKINLLLVSFESLNVLQ